MQCGHMLGESIVLEHVQQRRFAGIVQAEEQKFAGFFPKACKKMYQSRLMLFIARILPLYGGHVHYLPR